MQTARSPARLVVHLSGERTLVTALILNFLRVELGGFLHAHHTTVGHFAFLMEMIALFSLF
jgi:hypothetical protein